MKPPACPTHATPMRRHYTGVVNGSNAEWVWICQIPGCGKWKAGGVELKPAVNERPKR
jgi:hypothetical protein